MPRRQAPTTIASPRRSHVPIISTVLRIKKKIIIKENPNIAKIYPLYWISIAQRVLLFISSCRL